MSVDLSSVKNNDIDNDFIELNETKEPKETPVKGKKGRPTGSKKKVVEKVEEVKKTPKINEEVVTESIIRQKEEELNRKIQEERRRIFEKELKEVEEENKRQNEKVLKIALLNKINKYRSVFYKFLDEFNFENIENKKVEDLEIMLSQIKRTISNRNIEKNMKGMIALLPTVIETGGTYAGLQLEGYSQIVNSQEEYYYTCQEILIESNYYDSIKMTPIQRLGYILGSSALMVHQVNTQKNEKLNYNMAKDIETTRFNDL